MNFTLILNDVNRAPDWPSRLPANYNLLENVTVTFTYVALDPDVGPSTMSAFDLPFGSTFDATTGVFIWTPTFTQSAGPGRCTPYTPLIHPLYAPCTPVMHPLYTHYTPVMHSLYTP